MKKKTVSVKRSSVDWVIAFSALFLLCVVLSFEKVTKAIADATGTDSDTLGNVFRGGALVFLSGMCFASALAFASVPVAPIILAIAGVSIAGFLIYEWYFEDTQQVER